MKKIVVVLSPNADFHEMFYGNSPFIKETVYCTSMIRSELEMHGYEMIPYEDISRVDSCEAIFHFDRLRKDIIKKYPEKCHIYWGFEPAVVEPAHTKKGINRLANSVYDAVLTIHFDVLNERVYPIYMPIDIKYVPIENYMPEKLACLFSGDKFAFGKELYSLRRKVIRYAENNKIKGFSFYGRNWRKPYSDYECYKGFVDDKKKASVPYKFNFCFENEYGMTGGVTEKIFDSLCMGKVPIYRGAENIADYIPEMCYIDFRQFHSIEECFFYLESMTDEEYYKRVAAIREFMTSEDIRKKYSAKIPADIIVRICEEKNIHKSRKLFWLDYYKIKQKLYARRCQIKSILTRFLLN